MEMALITYQGTGFKKAIVELYDEEPVEGVPAEYRRIV